MTTQIINACQLGKALVEAGVVPANATRVIIDVPVGGGAVKIHTALLGEETLLDVKWAEIIGPGTEGLTSV